MNLEGLPYAVAPMELADVPTVSQVEQIVFTLPWSATAFDYELRHNRASEYVVLRYLPWLERPGVGQVLKHGLGKLLKRPGGDPSLLGYGGFWLASYEAHICTLAVRPEWRGRGLGELLLVSLVERALERGATVATLEVRASNSTGLNLYRKYRFRQVATRKHYYSDNGEDAVIMTTPSLVSAEYQEHLAALEDLLRHRLLAATQEA